MSSLSPTDAGDPTAGSAAIAVSPASRARTLLRSVDHAALATAGAITDGWPYPSLVQVAVDHAGAPLLLLSDLAEHSRNIAADGRVGLLFDGTQGLDHRLAGARLSVLGRAVRCEDGLLLERYLRRHPSARDYAAFTDFALYHVMVERAHLVAGFGAIHWISKDDLLLPNATVALIRAEADIVAHMNDDHADAVALYAGGILASAGQAAAGDEKEEGSGWIMTGIDPEGCDLRRGKTTVRVPFPRRADDVGQARQQLVERATHFRAMPGSQAIT